MTAPARSAEAFADQPGSMLAASPVRLVGSIVLDQVAPPDAAPRRALEGDQPSRSKLTVVRTDARGAPPRTRGDCFDVPRPCPWRACRYHLADIARAREPRGETCALDVAERGDHTLGEIGDILGLTRERIRQIESEGLAQLRRKQGAE